MKRPWLLVLALSLLVPAVPAQEAAPAAQGPADPAELEAFLDGIMATQLETHHVAGAAVAVVKDGKLFFAKGYGLADVKAGKPVIADRTLFRPGSVSKLFTWTAVMQLVEQGKIDLDADVNTYLKDFKVPATFPQPITMKHLMAHTPGFEDLGIGMWAMDAKDLTTLGEYLAAHMPARVRPPGVITSYSNYGSALAGHIVELVSGLSFEEYIEKNIFQPLGMAHSTFREPLPKDLAPDMSVGYTFRDGLFHAEDFELLNGIGPAGALSATATDMANFMIAHLQDGRFGEGRILKEETAKLMHSRLFSHDPRLCGNAHGFWELDVNRLRFIEHGGDTIYFHSQLALVPERNVGWFVSYNTSNGSAREDLLTALMNRYYPAEPPLAEPKPAAKASPTLREVAGTYSFVRHSYKTYEKLGLLMMPLAVAPTKEGTLLVKLPAGLGAQQYVEVSSYYFEQLGGQDRIVFRKDEASGVMYGFANKAKEFALARFAGYETPVFHYLLLGLTLLLFLSTFVGWPVAALTRFLCRRRCESGEAPKAARWLAALMSLVFIVSLLGVVASVMNQKQMMAGPSVLLKASLLLPFLAALLALGVLFYVLKAWAKSYWTRCHRLHYTLVFLAAVAYLWFLNFWNILGWRF